jgi:TonB family protein
MDTLHLEWHAEALSDEPVLEDAPELEAALRDADIKPKRSAAGWSVSLAVSMLCHLLALSAVAAFVVRSASSGRWQVARGNPFAQEGCANPGYAQRDDAIAARPITAAPANPSPPADHRETWIDPSLDDSSSLPQQFESLPAAPADVVIGIGPGADIGGASQRLPHFNSSKICVPASGSKAQAAQPAAGEMAPPRVAGPRGQRDGFDSRGLPIPDYPFESQRRGEQGLVVVDVEVLPDGRVGAVRVDSDAGYPRLGRAAAEKVKLATFVPARIDGRAVIGHIRIPYRFTLE